jgi:hypothetical protein
VGQESRVDMGAVTERSVRQGCDHLIPSESILCVLPQTGRGCSTESNVPHSSHGNLQHKVLQQVLWGHSKRGKIQSLSQGTSGLCSQPEGLQTLQDGLPLGSERGGQWAYQGSEEPCREEGLG